MEKWPDFFIVGAPRSGTTSLYEFLKLIPEIHMSPVKEPNYFSINVNSKLLFSKPIREKKEYLKLFQHTKNVLLAGEASPSYLWDPMASKLIYDVNPNAKIIIILRNPIERAFSHYLLLIGKGENDSQTFKEEFEKAMINNKDDFSGRIYESGLYSKQIERYLKIFGINNVKIFIFEEFFKDVNHSLIDVIEFLKIKTNIDNINKKIHNSYSIPRGNFSKKILKNDIMREIGKKIVPHNVGEFAIKKILTKNAKKPTIRNDDYKFVKEVYMNDVKNLEKILGRTLPWGFN